MLPRPRHHRIGLRREDKNAWERRVALTPAAVARLVARGIEVWVERFDQRAFADEDYLEAGARLVDDVRGAEIVLGIKEMPEGWFREGAVVAFFSHTIKGQSFNMQMLAELVRKRCSLVDYECVADDAGRRLVYFSHHAGVNGMIDSLWTLGERLRVLGHASPFDELRPAHRYTSVAEAERAIRRAGERIVREGVPAELRPLVFGFTGRGNVSRGVAEVFELLPFEDVAPEELDAWIAAHRASGDSGESSNRIARVHFDTHHLVERITDGGFDKSEYYEHPDRYRSRFARWLHPLTLLVHGVYWDARSPRFVTRDDFTALLTGENPARLVAVGDITCDVDGSLACTVRDTEPGNPVYVYDPVSGEGVDGFEGPGVAVMAVGNLPTELPVDASVTFSDAFEPFVPGLAACDLRARFEESGLPPEIARGTILWNGEFTPAFAYMRDFLA